MHPAMKSVWCGHAFKPCERLFAFCWIKSLKWDKHCNHHLNMSRCVVLCCCCCCCCCSRCRCCCYLCFVVVAPTSKVNKDRYIMIYKHGHPYQNISFFRSRACFYPLNIWTAKSLHILELLVFGREWGLPNWKVKQVARARKSTSLRC